MQASGDRQIELGCVGFPLQANMHSNTLQCQYSIWQNASDDTTVNHHHNNNIAIAAQMMNWEELATFHYEVREKLLDGIWRLSEKILSRLVL